MQPTNYTTVMVKFEEGGKQYTYKTYIEDFKVGDQAVVDVKGVTKVVTISQVHKAPRLDANAPWEYRWIVCKVDRDVYEQVERLRLAPVLDYTTREYDEDVEFDYRYDINN